MVFILEIFIDLYKDEFNLLKSSSENLKLVDNENFGDGSFEKIMKYDKRSDLIIYYETILIIILNI